MWDQPTLSQPVRTKLERVESFGLLRETSLPMNLLAIGRPPQGKLESRRILLPPTNDCCDANHGGTEEKHRHRLRHRRDSRVRYVRAERTSGGEGARRGIETDNVCLIDHSIEVR